VIWGWSAGGLKAWLHKLARDLGIYAVWEAIDLGKSHTNDSFGTNLFGNENSTKCTQNNFGHI